MCFQDVAFLPSRASFSTTFLKNVVEVNALGPPHFTTVFGGKQGYAPCNMMLLHEAPFVPVKFN